MVGQFHGKGCHTWIDGKMYDGEYINGKKHGTGTFVSNNGTKYEGEWKDGKQNGYGKQYNTKGVVTKEGNWINGKLT